MSEFVGKFNYKNVVTFTHSKWQTFCYRPISISFVFEIYPFLLSLEHTKQLEILVFLVHTIKVSGVQCCLDHNFLKNKVLDILMKVVVQTALDPTDFESKL